MITIWLRWINKKVKCHQMRYGIIITQYHFVAFIVLLIVHHFGTCHVRRRNMFPWGQKSTNFKLYLCLLRPWKRTRNSRRKSKDFFIHNLTLEHHKKREKQWNQTTLLYLHFSCSMRTGACKYTRYWVFFLLILRKVCLYWLFVSTERKELSLSNRIFEIVLTRFQELAFLKSCWKLCLVMVLAKKILHQSF